MSTQSPRTMGAPAGQGLEVGLRGVGVDGHGGPCVGHHAHVAEAPPNELGYVELRHPGDEVDADVAIGLLHDLGQLRRRRPMRGKLLRRPAQKRVLAQVRGGDDLDAQPSHQLHRARVDQGDPGQRRVGRVLHGHAPLAAQEASERGDHPALGGEDRAVEPRRGEPPRVDVVYQQPGPPTRRDQEPAGPCQMAHRPRHLEEERVGAAIVVDEPGVGAVASQVGLGPGERRDSSIALAPTPPTMQQSPWMVAPDRRACYHARATTTAARGGGTCPARCKAYASWT